VVTVPDQWRDAGARVSEEIQFMNKLCVRRVRRLFGSGLSRPAGVVAGVLLATAMLVTLAARTAEAKVVMSADGPAGTATYALLQQAYTTELPDCGHMVPHITEVFDDDLKKNVFVFHLHVNQDDDRCGAQDRQRTEIRAKSAGITANNGETVYYRWKFKLPAGFQTSPNFTHIFQIKSDQAAPIMTLTPRGSTLSIDGRIGKHGETDLAKFLNVWVVVDLKILYGNAGRVEMTIRKLSDGQVMFQYAGAADTWDDNASLHDIKHGIYRSLNNRDQLRDEQVRFADFCTSKVNNTECNDDNLPPPPPPPDGGAPPPPPPPAPDGGAPPPPPPPAAPDAAPPPPPAPTDGAVAPTPPPKPPLPAPAPPPPPPEVGCGCRLASPPAAPAIAVPVTLAALALLLRRRRRR
jgi:MYXO-CTERM domain-containing protein